MPKSMEVQDKMIDLFVNDSADVNDYADIGTDDIAIPFLNILQDLSPQVKKGPSQIAGCESGDIFENVTSRVWKGDQGVTVVPCAFQKRFVEWVPRLRGGGFVASHENEKMLMDCKQGNPDDKETRGKLFLPNGNELVPTSLHFVLIVDRGTTSKAVISMTKTKRKKSRQWIGMMTSNRITKDGREYLPRMFQYSYHLTSVMETKNTDSYFNWKIGQAVRLTEEQLSIYETGKLFNATFMKAKVNLSEDSDDGENIPF